MINTLHIKNIGIIDDLSLDLNKGLNILTGETGAGKTLIIDSLALICGERFSKEMLRKDETHSFVEASLYLPQNEENIEGNIIVSRDIYSNGKNLCKINGRMVTVNELKEFMSKVIDIHGQHDNQNLLDSSTHILYLDNFIGREINTLKEEYQNLFKQYIEVNLELKQNYGDDKEKQRKLDLLKYQLNEIEASNLRIGEEEVLEEKRNIIVNSEKINENLQMADMQISENTIDSINIAIRALEKIENIDNKYSKILNSLKNNYYELQEIGRDINNFREESYLNEEEKQNIEERLDLIYSLKRKYGNNIEEILEYKNSLCNENSAIENMENYICNLKEKLSNLENNMYNICNKLTEKRQKYSAILSKEINKELKDLEMKNAIINIKVENKKEFDTNGLNKVEILIKTNAGEDKKPLNKIASGGEMSRIMLAIKKVLSEVDTVPILVFDEIDTGISGIAANSVADKLKTISKMHQTLCITHLAVIAAKGNVNYYISKESVNNKTKTKIKLLNSTEKIEEIARIASGNITKISLEHAKELISA